MNDFTKKVIFVMFGGTIQGLGMGLFLFPQSIPSGGAGGLAILLNYFLKVPMAPALWIANFSLLLFGVKYLGNRFALLTLFGIIIVAFSIAFFDSQIIIPNLMLHYYLVFGFVFLGIEVWILMRQGVVNGGVGVLAYMIAHKKNLLPRNPLFYLNLSIFLITAASINWKT